MKNKFLFVLAVALLACAGVLGAVRAAASTDALAPFLEKDALDAFSRKAPADVYNKDNVFELINGEAELYFPYGLQRVLAADYTDAAIAEATFSVELYELNSLLDAFGVFSNYRDDASKPADVGAEGVGGSTQVMFYQDKYFVKARVSKQGQEAKLLEFAKSLSKALPQNFGVPAEPGLLEVAGVVLSTRQYLAQSILGYDFFKKGLVAKAFLDEPPAADAKPVRVFVLLESSARDAEDVLGKYIEYLDQNQGAHEWVEGDGGRILKATDPLHKGMLLKVEGTKVLGVAKLAPEADGMGLMNRLAEKAKGVKGEG